MMKQSTVSNARGWCWRMQFIDERIKMKNVYSDCWSASSKINLMNEWACEWPFFNFIKENNGIHCPHIVASKIDNIRLDTRVDAQL